MGAAGQLPSLGAGLMNDDDDDVMRSWWLGTYMLTSLVVGRV